MSFLGVVIILGLILFATLEIRSIILTIKDRKKSKSENKEESE